MSFGRIIKAVHNYIVFFLIVAFVVSCSMMLFITTMADTMNIVLSSENIEAAAKITMVNVLLLTFLLTMGDYIRRRITIDRPVKKIREGLDKIKNGDFSARICVPDSPQKFGEIADSINLLASELSGVETLRTDFIANVSHELKTPLAVIRNYATMLQSPDLSEEDRLDYAKGITESSRRLADLITNILKLNKLENQQIFPTAKPYDLSEQLCECLLQFEEIWEKKDIEIETEIADEVTVNADSELLSLVWNNLLSNAFKFTDNGGKVCVSLISGDYCVVVKIADTGCGISRDVGKHIFEKFYQGDTSHAARGNGLGLALVKRVIDITGGDISVESEVGKGSVFTVILKRSNADGTEKAAE